MSQKNALPRWTVVLIALFLLPALAQADEPREKIQRATQTFTELLSAPDRGVPEELLANCDCVASFPSVVKGAIGYGARRGYGIASCRDEAGNWGPISFFTMNGGSAGLQIGVEKSEFVLFFMTPKSARSLLQSKFTLGAQAGVAAGPVGRKAEASTDLKLDAEIYTYGKSKGLFAGIALEGARLAEDKKENKEYYGRPVKAADLLFTNEASKSAEETAFREALPKR